MSLQPFGGSTITGPSLNKFGEVGICENEKYLARLRIVLNRDLLAKDVLALRVSCDDETEAPNPVSEIRCRLI